MESGRFLFDTSARLGNMLFLGNRDSVFRGPRSVIYREESSKRPFFSSPEDMFDEEYYDEQLPEKKRRLTSEQVHQLEKSFEAENKLEPERKTQLAKKLGLQPRRVAVWFQNRRARSKTKQLERGYSVLKSNYESLLSDYECILKENEKLKSEVVFLGEKLQPKEDTTTVEHTTDEKQKSPCQIMTSHASPAQSDLVKFEGSMVVEEDALQLVNTSDSYLPGGSSCYVGCVEPIQYSEEDDGSDDGRSYFSNVFVAAAIPQPVPYEETMGWWVWS